MPANDVVLDGLATEDDPAPPPRSGGRGFWIVTTALACASIFMLVEIFTNFGTKDTIAHAEHSLDVTQAAAAQVKETDGSYADADSVRLGAVEPTLRFAPGTEPSAGLDEVSVAVAGADWGAAVQARSGACFYLHLNDDGTVLYGVGTVCTGEEALRASDPRW
jgi:hypothetical protein